MRADCRNFPSTWLLALPCALLATLALRAQSAPIAIQNARIVTLAGAPIERGTLLMQDGKITAIGADVRVPAGAKIVDAAGGTVMPGLVSAWSRAGLEREREAPAANPFQRGRRGRNRDANPGPTTAAPVNRAAAKVADQVYARQDVYGELLACGVTTQALVPSGTGFTGLAAVIDPSASREQGFVRDDDAYVAVGTANNTKTKELLGKALDDAKKVLDERKKPPAPAQPATPPASQPTQPSAQPIGPEPAPQGPHPAEPPKPEAPKPETPKPESPKDGPKPDAPKPPEKKKDENLEVIADLLDGKRRAFVTAASASDLAHYAAAIKDHRFKTTVVAARHEVQEGTIDVAVETLKKLDAAVLMTPRLTRRPYAVAFVDPAQELRKAGIAVGYFVGDDKREVRDLFGRLTELVRYGTAPDDALRAVTAIPAKMLGVEAEVGTLEVGKRADVLLFDGDPLEPASTLKRVFCRGVAVGAEAER